MASSKHQAPADGVIKFSAEHRFKTLQANTILDVLTDWRQVLWRLGLIGQDPGRYDGAGFGNISCLSGSAVNHSAFYVSGTQTGGNSDLLPADFAEVLGVDIPGASVVSIGGRKPSSESLTHAAIYSANPSVSAVVHVHSPVIWMFADNMSAPCVSEKVAYGTVEMAKALGEITRDARHNGIDRGCVVMKGHQDGVIAWDTSIQRAAFAVIGMYARAKQLAR